MNIDQAINILTEHNKWRRGQPPYEFGGEQSAHTPKQIGEAIDFAVDVMARELSNYNLWKQTQ